MTDPDAEPRIVKVRLQLPDPLDLPLDAVLRIRVEDVSAADRPSDVVAEEAIPVGELSGVEVEVRVPAGLVDRRASYSVFVHVDQNGSGQIEVGDYLSPAAHPVLTQGAGDAVDVPLLRVGG